VLGIIILWSTGALSEGSVFIIFPFFFYGDVNIVSVAIIIILTSMFLVVALCLISNFVLKTDSQSHLAAQDIFIPISTRCMHCSKSIPINSSYCLFCGSPVEHNDESNKNL
jgi:hypothetical protein